MSRLSSSRDQRVRQLLTHEEMGSQAVPVFTPPEEPGAGRARRFREEHLVQPTAPRHIQTILAGRAESNLNAASQLADRIAKVAPLPTTAFITQAPEASGLLQKIEDLSPLTRGRTRQRSYSRNTQGERRSLPSLRPRGA